MLPLGGWGGSAGSGAASHALLMVALGQFCPRLCDTLSEGHSLSLGICPIDIGVGPAAGRPGTALWLTGAIVATLSPTGRAAGKARDRFPPTGAVSGAGAGAAFYLPPGRAGGDPVVGGAVSTTSTSWSSHGWSLSCPSNLFCLQTQPGHSTSALGPPPFPRGHHVSSPRLTGPLGHMSEPVSQPTLLLPGS